MRQAVAAALERLATRIEFNDGFELDLITPETWLAERHARAVIEGWGRDDVEIVEVRLGVEGDVLAPSRRLVEALEPRAGRTVMVLHTIDDGVDVASWQLVFRRLNENRNAIVREFVGNLVVLLAPRLVQSFAAEAPDMWSIGATLVVGTRTHEQLFDAMLEHFHALLRLTRETHQEAAMRARVVAPTWALALSQSSATMRARQLFELLFEYDHEQLLLADTPAEIKPCILSGFRLSIAIDESHRSLLNFPGVWAHSGGHFAKAVVSPQALSDLDALTAIWQAEASASIRVGLVASIDPAHPSLSALRHCVDLVLVSHPGRSWRVIPGDTQLAAVVGLGATEMFKVDFTARGVAHIEFGNIDLGVHSPPPEQLWLPGINPHDLGSAPLYRPQPHH